MLTHNLGYPRIGDNRQLKKACESYWSGKITQDEFVNTGKLIRKFNWLLQKELGIDLIPSNDFSYYDHILDMSLMVGNIPKRYNGLMNHKGNLYDLYFAMARGYQKDGFDIPAMEMTKWFDTNYHYIVPEFVKDQEFHLLSSKVISEYAEAKSIGITTTPIIIGPITYLLSGKEKEPGFHRLELLDRLLPVYIEIIKGLIGLGVEWIQFDEPILVMELDESERKALEKCYSTLHKQFPMLNVLLATYFGSLGKNKDLALSLPISALHIDIVRAPEQLNDIITNIPPNLILSLGIVDGRNVWKNDFDKSMSAISKGVSNLGSDRIILSPSCSLLHTPCNLELETNSDILKPQIKQWLAFAKQKLEELSILKGLANPKTFKEHLNALTENQLINEGRKISKFIHKESVTKSLKKVKTYEFKRKSNFAERQKLQKQIFNFPLFPTTTIGSFPQTEAIRNLRLNLKKKKISLQEYETQIEEQIDNVIKLQEDIGLDVLVHGEYERNDMVEYFGEQLEGFAFTQNGWVQSYGSRCVKPPIIFGDVERPKNMTSRWIKYAQSKTDRMVKGMLTGPITMLQWSFVRDDQAREITAMQIAIAIGKEVKDLENAGIRVIQIDEPALREGLPLKKTEWKGYLDWAVNAFRVTSSVVKDTTQIHTHMCYSEFNDIIDAIAKLDADVITIETSRSQMELLDVFGLLKYPNEVGPGVYDIHSPRIPTVDEIIYLLEKAITVLPKRNIWVNPDCGLKTRKPEEAEAALRNMVKASILLRSKYDYE